MAENEQPAPAAAPDHLTSDERSYFTSRGETPIPEPAPEAAPAAEPTPEPSAAPLEPSVTAAEPSAPPPPKMVDSGALGEERNRRKEAEERARQAEAQQARMEERIRMWQQQQQPRQQLPQQPPNPDQDIFGAVNHVMRTQQQMAQELNATRQQQAQREAITQLEQWGAHQQGEFAKQTPDYFEALTHLRQSRGNELQAFGLNPQQTAAQLLQEERQLLSFAAQQRRNPAEMAYAFAQQRGYRKGVGNGGNPSQQLDRISAGQQAARSLSGVGGNAGGGAPVGVEELLKMPMAEFAAYKAKNPAKFRRLKGG
jgi:signal transduction histidine kinase